MIAAIATIVLHFESGTVRTGTIVYPANAHVLPGFACATIAKGHRLIPATLNVGRADRVLRVECHE